MANKLKEKSFDCIKFKESLQAALWKESKASDLEEYAEWLKNEHARIAQEREKRAAHLTAQ
jgi:hypothetical protein